MGTNHLDLPYHITNESTSRGQPQCFSFPSQCTYNEEGNIINIDIHSHDKIDLEPKKQHPLASVTRIRSQDILF